MKKIYIDTDGYFFQKTMAEIENRIQANDQKFAFVLSTQRLIERVRNRLLDQFEQLIDVRIISFDELFLQTDSDDLMSRILLDIAIRRAIEDRKLPDRYFYRSKGFKNLAQKYIYLFKNHLKTAVEFDQIAKGSDFELLSVVYRYYESVKEEYEIQDRYDRYFQTIHFPDLDTVYIDGFYDFRPIEYSVLQRLIEQGVRIVILFHGLPSYYDRTLQKLQKMGFEVNTADSLQEKTATKDIYECDDRYLEVKKMAIEIRKDEKSGASYRDMAIIAPEEYFEDIRRVFSDAHIPHRLSVGQPVFQYKIFRDLKYILQADTINDWLTAFFKTGRLVSFDKDTEPLEEALKHCSFRDFFELTSQLDAKIRMEWEYELDQIFQLYDRQKNSSTFDFVESILREEKEAAEGEYLEVLEEVIHTLQTAHESAKRLLDHICVRDFVMDLLENFRKKSATYQPDAIQMMTVLDCRIFPVQYLYMVGMTDENYPSLRKENYYYRKKNIQFLKKFGIEMLSPSEESRRQRMNFQMAVRMATKRLVFFYSLNENQRSPYLNDCESISYTLKNFIRPVEWIDRFDAEKQQLYQKKEYQTPDVTLEHLSTYSTTALETYQTCPRKYFYRYMLQLKTGENEFLVLGNILHETLRIFYEQEMKDPKDPDYEVLDEVLRSQFIEHIQDWDDYPNQLSYLLYRDRLKELVDADLQSFLTTTYRPYQLEVPFQKTIEKDGRTIRLQGKLDRIDKNKEGKLRIIDYKRTKSSVHPFSDFEKDRTLQFPIYSLSDDITSCYYQSIDPVIRQCFFDREDTRDDLSHADIFQAFQKDVCEKIFFYVEKIENGEFEESAKNIETCKYCDYQKICRVRKS